MMDQVKPYNQLESKKSQVKKMFDSIAKTYDFNNRLLSFRIDVLWRNQLIKALKYQKAKNILDVATGTGDVALEMAKKISGSTITGIDISAGMLEVGQKKIVQQKLSNQVKIGLGDAEAIEHHDNSFDAVTVAFGVRNFERLEIGLAEMLRVLKPGGILAILEFSHPKKQPVSAFYNFYFSKILPQIGKMTSKDPSAYKYLYESVKAFPEGDNFVEILRKIGGINPECKTLSFGICSLYIVYK